MGRALLAVGTMLVLCIAVLVLSVSLTQEDDSFAVDNLLAETLSREIATAQDNERQVDLARLTDFSWDRVLVVAEDTPRARVEQALGSRFQGQLNYDVESAELFLFLRDGKLVRFADYRGRGRFTGLRRPVAELTPEQAVFEVHDLVVRPARRPD